MMTALEKLEERRCAKCPAHTGGFNGEDYDDDCHINPTYGEKFCWKVLLPHWAIQILIERKNRIEDKAINECINRWMEDLLSKAEKRNAALEACLRGTCRVCIHDGESINDDTSPCYEYGLTAMTGSFSKCEHWEFDEARFAEVVK
jgi:hypothetical protein